MDAASSTANKIQPYGKPMPEQYELSGLEITGSEQLARLAVSDNMEGAETALQTVPNDGVTVQELAPMDRGVRAWTFCCCAFVMETMIWGFCFRSVVYSTNTLNAPLTGTS